METSGSSTFIDFVDPRSSDYELSDKDDEDYFPDLDNESEDDYSDDEQQLQQHQKNTSEGNPTPGASNCGHGQAAPESFISLKYIRVPMQEQELNFSALAEVLL